jgi:hypothetical protein
MVNGRKKPEGEASCRGRLFDREVEEAENFPLKV